VDPDGQGCSDFKTRRHFSGSATLKAKAAAQERESTFTYEITKAGLAKFAKRLTSKDKSSNNKVIHQFPSAIPNM
ncbi:hypothetical protein TNIN_135141, partial [Trichonephila inaurata madagascariensis]